MPLLTPDQIEAIMARADAVYDARSPLRRLRGHTGRDWLNDLLERDAEWRGLTDKQRDLIGRKYWLRSSPYSPQVLADYTRSKMAQVENATSLVEPPPQPVADDDVITSGSITSVGDLKETMQPAAADDEPVDDDPLAPTREFIKKEREAITARRDELLAQRAGIQTQIDRLEAALGQFAQFDPAPAPALVPVVSGKGTKQDEILRVIQGGPALGMTRGDVIERMGQKGNKSGEGSISNALKALMDGHKINRVDGRYMVPP